MHAIDEKLKEGIDTLQILLNATKDLMLLLDHDGNVQVMNEALAERFKATVAVSDSLTVN